MCVQASDSTSRPVSDEHIANSQAKWATQDMYREAKLYLPPSAKDGFCSLATDDLGQVEDYKQTFRFSRRRNAARNQVQSHATLPAMPIQRQGDAPGPDIQYHQSENAAQLAEQQQHVHQAISEIAVQRQQQQLERGISAHAAQLTEQQQCVELGQSLASPAELLLSPRPYTAPAAAMALEQADPQEAAQLQEQQQHLDDEDRQPYIRSRGCRGGKKNNERRYVLHAC